MAELLALHQQWRARAKLIERSETHDELMAVCEALTAATEEPDDDDWAVQNDPVDPGAVT